MFALCLEFCFEFCIQCVRQIIQCMNERKISEFFQISFRTPGLLSQFIADLHSGKLHREFHHGPDPTTTPPAPGVCINYSNDLTLR